MLGKEKYRVCKRLSRASWDALEWAVSFGRSCLISIVLLYVTLNMVFLTSVDGSHFSTSAQLHTNLTTCRFN